MDCFLKCVCKATDIDEDTLKKELNINPYEIVYEAKAPYCYRGYSPELINLVLPKFGYTLGYYGKTIEESNYFATYKLHDVELTQLSKHFSQIIHCSNTHAVLYNGNGDEIYNPYPEVKLTELSYIAPILTIVK